MSFVVIRRGRAIVHESRVAQRRSEKLECPKCRTHHLVVALDEGIEVDACPTCKGVWVDVVEEKELLRMKPEVLTVDEVRRLRKLYQPLGKREKVGYFPCPICKRLMHRKNWGSHSRAVVDKCEDHGTWYDADELEKVREYVILGGTEFEKLRLTEKGLSELQSKLTQEVTRLDVRINWTARLARIFSWLGL